MKSESDAYVFFNSCNHLNINTIQNHYFSLSSTFTYC